MRVYTKIRKIFDCLVIFPGLFNLAAKKVTKIMFTISEVSSHRSRYVTGFVSDFQHIYLISSYYCCPAIILHELVTLLEAYNQMNSPGFVMSQGSFQLLLEMFHGVMRKFPNRKTLF